VNPFLDLHWYNIPKLPSKSTTEDHFFKNLYTLTGLPKNTPTFVYMYNGSISDLTKIDHDVEVQNILNEKGIHFFLYEPLCYKETINGNHNQYFYTEIEYAAGQKFYADEIESIKEYSNKNNLSNINIHTCDYNVCDYIVHEKNVKLFCDDIFIKNQSFKHIDVYEKKIIKKFICLNWRYTKHRHLISTFLANKSCNLSWYYKTTFEDLREGLWFDIDQWKSSHPILYEQIINGIIILNDTVPRCLDIKHNDVTVYNINGSKNLFPSNDYKSPSLINHNTDNLLKFYQESFCEIITETRFAQPTANFSEKILQAIRYRTPFIVLGPPNVLKYLKTFGFKTFDKFWNEDYDDCLNHEERIIKILNIINDIEKYNMDQLDNLYRDMYDILDHNYKNLKNMYE